VATPVLLFGTFIVWTVIKAEDPARMACKWVVTAIIGTIMVWKVAPMVGEGGYGGAFGGIPLAALCSLGLAITWRHNLAELVARPIASLYDGGNVAPEPRPAYSVAQARQKQGRSLEAIAEIRQQLARFPTDFEGHLLLAQIQAEDLKDLPGAELTIDRLCSQPGHAPANVAFALYSLADWHLKLTKDADAARRALERVIALLPDTEFAFTAAQRIARLGDSNTPLDPHAERMFSVPQGVRNLGLLSRPTQPPPAEPNPDQLAEDLVARLEKHPLDSASREQLAVLYADHYGRLDLATSQLEELLQQPNHPARLQARWLNLLADLQIRSSAGYDVIRQTLQRIVDHDPEAAAAGMARNRIELLKLELKGKERGQTVKMGTYEQNIGLKHGPPSPQSA